MLKFYAEKWPDFDFDGGVWLDFWGGPGGKGGGRIQNNFNFRFQKDFYLDLTRGAPQAGCGGKNAVQDEASEKV